MFSHPGSWSPARGQEPSLHTPMKASDLLRADHRKIEAHLDRLLHALKHLSADQVSDIRRSFQGIQQIAEIHFQQEEGIFYPAMRSMAPDLLSKMEQQHEDVRETERCLGDLLSTFPETPSDRDLVELFRLGIEFHDAVQCHIVDEEDHLLQYADSKIPDEQQQRLFAEMQRCAFQNPA
ncbi:MAG: hemerythrin domain-containing protein [Acidobacteria bacterium]|nr:hemerythrin domain-containing protein [Acidobacteriota bacterium]